MGVGEIAGLIAAVAFVALVGLLAMPILRLARVFDEATRSLRELTAHSVPVLDESANAVATASVQLGKVDTITTSAAQTAENVSALAGLYAATLGKPAVKVASLTYGARQAFSGASKKLTERNE